MPFYIGAVEAPSMGEHQRAHRLGDGALRWPQSSACKPVVMLGLQWLCASSDGRAVRRNRFERGRMRRRQGEGRRAQARRMGKTSEDRGDAVGSAFEGCRATLRTKPGEIAQFQRAETLELPLRMARHNESMIQKVTTGSDSPLTARKVAMLADGVGGDDVYGVGSGGGRGPGWWEFRNRVAHSKHPHSNRCQLGVAHQHHTHTEELGRAEFRTNVPKKLTDPAHWN